jgi:hypothetical protein
MKIAAPIFVTWVMTTPARARLSGSKESERHDVAGRRRLIEVGANPCPPGKTNCEPRGTDEQPCSEFFGNKNVCDFPKALLKTEATYCIWYGGFTEYECGCKREETDYCTEGDVDDVVYCIEGYSPTQMTLNGGRVFWSCNPNPKQNPNEWTSQEGKSKIDASRESESLSVPHRGTPTLGCGVNAS